MKQANEVGDQVARAVIDTMVESIVVIDELGVIQYVNPATLGLFGHSEAELLGQSVSMLVPEEPLANLVRNGNPAIIGAEREVEGLRKGGDSISLGISVVESFINTDRRYIAVLRDISEREYAQKAVATSNRLTRAVNRTLSQYIGSHLWARKGLFDDTLQELLGLSQSSYGFIGEILHTEESIPYLKTHAITDISWNKETRELYARSVQKGMEFFNLNTLFGETIRTGDLVIANNPDTDPRRGGLPPGHPVLHAYCGLPIYAGNKFVGMAGIANRAGGYDEDLAEHLRPFLVAIGSMIAGFQNLESRRRAEQDLHRAQQKLRVLATQDDLTGVASRGSLLDGLTDAFQRTEAVNTPMSVLFIDLDHFKAINDQHGHARGDKVLKKFASILQATIRPSDIVGRFGGEEFLVGLIDGDPNLAFAVAERLRLRVQAETRRGEEAGDCVPVTISVGIATRDPGVTEVMELIRRADKALYQAKGHGRNCVSIYRAEGAES